MYFPEHARTYAHTPAYPCTQQTLNKEEKAVVEGLGEKGSALACTLDKAVIKSLLQKSLVWMAVPIADTDRIASMSFS